MKEESGKDDLKLNINKTKTMASSPITSWQIDGEKTETVAGFIFLGSKIAADGDCSHEIKTRLLLGTNLDSVFKSRHITLLTKVRYHLKLASNSILKKQRSWPSSTITSWKIEGETVKAVIDFPFLGSKISANSDCSQEI